MKTKLQALFEGAPKESIVSALGELGYIPKLEGAVVLSPVMIPAVSAALGIEAAQLSGDLAKIDFAKLGAAAVAPAVEAAKKEARTETLAYVQGIHESCALGGKPEMAAALIKAETTLEDARTKILEEKAKGAGRSQIRSTIGGTSADAPNPLLEDAKQRSGAK